MQSKSVSIFIDDYRVSITPGEWANQGDSFGFVSAIVNDDTQSEVVEAVKREISLMQGKGFNLIELHGQDIVSAKNGWEEIEILDRVELLSRVLEASKRANVQFIWELVQEGRDEFKRVRKNIHTFFKEDNQKLHKAALDRWDVKNDPRLSIATVLRRASLMYSITNLRVNKISIYEDMGIPKCEEHDRPFIHELQDKGIEISWNTSVRSELNYGIQIADIAGTVIRIATNIERLIDYKKSKDLWPCEEIYNAFNRVLYQHGVVELLETGKRTFRAVDL